MTFVFNITSSLFLYLLLLLLLLFFVTTTTTYISCIWFNLFGLLISKLFFKSTFLWASIYILLLSLKIFLFDDNLLILILTAFGTCLIGVIRIYINVGGILVCLKEWLISVVGVVKCNILKISNLTLEEIEILNPKNLKVLIIFFFFCISENLGTSLLGLYTVIII